jgi:uncharacterized protein
VSSPELFRRDRVAGVFRGFREGGLEFHADLALPYQTQFQSIPMHGQFLLVQLETPDEAVLGRITALSSEGRLAGSVGEEFNMRAIRDDRPVPEQLRRDYLKYRILMRVLGVVRLVDGKVQFAPSHRRLPHVGSPVAFLEPDILAQIVGSTKATPIGVIALGEYVYAGSSTEVDVESWMQCMSPEVRVGFDAENLVSRRTFVFARAGFGKSNLNKLLFSRLYTGEPTVRKAGGRRVPVGTVIFDPDGEYFWPDDKGRPGLCDVPALREKLVVFTSRSAPSAFYGSFVAGGIKLDIRRLSPADVISIALSPEKQGQQNVRKLRSMGSADWAELVDLIDRSGNGADLGQVMELLKLDDRQDVEALAARANMTSIVRTLHDRGSQLMDLLLAALSDGKLCIVDVSQLRGGASLVLSGLILRRIFDRNQEEFTKADPRTIPTIAVVEEAQSVLNEGSSTAAPYVEWVKEGRKYDLGAVLITQQPGSIPIEILSQGDNWFIFHLLSSADLQTLRKANAHFSEDLLATLLNEPIRGQGLLWSSAAENPFPIPIRVASFERLYAPVDSSYSLGEVATYAARLRERLRAENAVGELIVEAAGIRPARPLDGGLAGEPADVSGVEDGLDPFRAQQAAAVERLRRDEKLMDALRDPKKGVTWKGLSEAIKAGLPPSMSDRDQVAFNLVKDAASRLLGGPQGTAWTTERRPPKNSLWIVRVNGLAS